MLNVFIIQIKYTAQRNTDKSSNFDGAEAMGNYNGVLNLHHVYYTTIMTSRRLFRHTLVPRGTNQPIRKSEFVQCVKVDQ